MEHVQRRQRLLILLALGSLTVMPGAVIAPVLPEIVQQFQLDRASAGYLVSAHYLTVAIFSPILGLLSERIGRVRVLVAAALCFAMAGIAGTLAEGFLPMLATRGLLGAATGGIAAASLGILASMYTHEEERSQAIAYASAAITLANIVYPLLAGWIGSSQWQVAFYLYGLGLPLGLLAALLLPERLAKKTTPSISNLLKGQDVGTLFQRNTRILPLFITVGLSAAIAYATVIYLPLYLHETLHSETTTNGLVLACQAIGAAIVSAFGVKPLIRRYGAVTSIALGLAVMALGLVTIPQLQQLHQLIPIVLLFGVGMGITVTSHYATIANLAPLNSQTITLAIATSMNFLGQFSSPTLFGMVLREHGLTIVFYAAAGIAAITGIVLLLTFKHWKPLSRS